MTEWMKRPVRAYILRLWAEDDNGRHTWRFSLTPISSQTEREQAIGFASLEATTTYLQAQMDQQIRQFPMSGEQHDE